MAEMQTEIVVAGLRRRGLEHAAILRQRQFPHRVLQIVYANGRGPQHPVGIAAARADGVHHAVRRRRQNARRDAAECADLAHRKPHPGTLRTVKDGAGAVKSARGTGLWCEDKPLAIGEARAMYKLTPEDRQYVDEFRQTPVGHHSPGLQRILNLFRGEAMAGKYVLVCTKPHQEWMLGQLTGVRGERIRMTNHVFTSLAEAEWYVFKQRWKRHTGEDLPD